MAEQESGAPVEGLGAEPSAEATGDTPPSQPGVGAGSQELSQKLDRYKQQVDGFAPFGKKLKELGVRSPEDLDRLVSADRIEKSGLDLDKLAEAFASEEEPEPTQIDPDQIATEVFEKLSAKQAKELAEVNWRQGWNEEKGMVEEAAKKAVGSDATDFEVGLYKTLLTERAELARQEYPEGHPLHGRVGAPLNQKQIDALMAEIVKSREESHAKRVAQRGDEVNEKKRAPAAVAGNGTGQGAPEKGQPLSRREAALQMREKLENKLKQMRAAQG